MGQKAAEVSPACTVGHSYWRGSARSKELCGALILQLFETTQKLNEKGTRSQRSQIPTSPQQASKVLFLWPPSTKINKSLQAKKKKSKPRHFHSIPFMSFHRLIWSHMLSPDLSRFSSLPRHTYSDYQIHLVKLSYPFTLDSFHRQAVHFHADPLLTSKGCFVSRLLMSLV